MTFAHLASDRGRRDEANTTTSLNTPAACRRGSGNTTSLASVLHPISRANAAATRTPIAISASVASHGGGSKEGTPRLSCDFAPTNVAAAAPFLSKQQRSPHYLPELNFADDTLTPPLLATGNTCRDSESNTGAAVNGFAWPVDRDVSVARPTTKSPTLCEDKPKATPELHVNLRRLSPFSPLALSSSSASTPTGTSPQTTATATATAVAAGVTSPRTCATIPVLTHHNGPTANTYTVPRASPAKNTTFEHRRIPLPPPAVVAGAIGNAIRHNNIGSNNNSALNTGSGSGNSKNGVEAPSSSVSAASISNDGVESKLVRNNVQALLNVPRAQQLSSRASCCISASPTASLPHPKNAGNNDSTHNTTSPSPIFSTTTTNRATLFAPVTSSNNNNDGSTQGEKQDSSKNIAAAGTNARAPTPLRSHDTTQRPLPPMPPPLSPSPLTRKPDLADREQAQMVRHLLQWRHCGRHRQTLTRTRNADDLRYDMQPITVQPSRPSRMLNSDHFSDGDAVDEAEEEADNNNNDANANVSNGSGLITMTAAAPPAVIGLSLKALELEGTVSAIEIVSPDTEAAVALRRANVTTSRVSRGSADEAASRQHDSSSLYQQQQQQQHRYHSHRGSSRSHLSIVSRCSTPDGNSAEGGSSSNSGGGSAHFCKYEASPKHVSNGSVACRSLPSDRLFARPSSTSLTMDSRRESSGWSRGEAGLWGGGSSSSRHMNLSTLTISCAPALGSFSTNSDSSLLP